MLPVRAAGMGQVSNNAPRKVENAAARAEPQPVQFFASADQVARAATALNEPNAAAATPGAAAAPVAAPAERSPAGREIQNPHGKVPSEVWHPTPRGPAA